MNMILINKKNFNNLNINYMLFFMLFFSTIIVLNSSSWFSAWMGMEMNMLSFIPLMKNNKNFLKQSNSMMMYFIIQSISSSMLIFFMLNLKMLNMKFFYTNLISSFMLLSLILKLGAAPFHWWIPKIMNNLSWTNCLILMTWQKIAPIILMNNLNNIYMIYLSAIFSSVIGSIMSINQTSLKMILSFSSINHLGWMMMSLMFNFKILILYFTFYSLINMIICMNLNKFNLNYMNQMFKINNNKMIKLIMNSSFLSLAGIPPFLGFLPKFFIIILLIKNNMIFETFLMIILTLIILSMYMNPFISSLMLNKINIKWMNKINKNLNSNKFNFYVINLTLMLLISMWFFKMI